MSSERILLNCCWQKNFFFITQELKGGRVCRVKVNILSYLIEWKTSSRNTTTLHKANENSHEWKGCVNFRVQAMNINKSHCSHPLIRSIFIFSYFTESHKNEQVAVITRRTINLRHKSFSFFFTYKFWNNNHDERRRFALLITNYELNYVHNSNYFSYWFSGVRVPGEYSTQKVEAKIYEIPLALLKLSIFHWVRFLKENELKGLKIRSVYFI